MGQFQGGQHANDAATHDNMSVHEDRNSAANAVA